MFENIAKFFRKLMKSEEKHVPSKETAKERLHLVLMQDRANVSADFLELMKQEIIEVIKKYIEVEESAIDVRLTNEVSEDGTQGAPSLYANIPILKIKHEMKNEAKKDENNSSKEDAKTNNKKDEKKESNDKKSSEENKKDEEIKQEDKDQKKEDNKEQSSKEDKNKDEKAVADENKNKNKNKDEKTVEDKDVDKNKDDKPKDKEDNKQEEKEKQATTSNKK